MYTVVLMAALTSGSATPDWHRHGCHGCHGAVTSSCYGCYGSCYGCYGGGYAAPGYGGLCIGTYGGYAVSGPNPAYGCWGAYGLNNNLTFYSGNGCYGYGPGVTGGYGLPGYGVSFQCHGCYGCYGGWACYGSPTAASGYQNTDTTGPGAMSPVPTNPLPPVTVPAPSPMPKREETKVRSKVIIEVPQNAKLYVDDTLMKDGPTQRVFETPPLDPNQAYFYEVKVETVVKGKTVTNSQRLVIRPGGTVTADLREPGRPDIVTARNTPAMPPK